MSIFQPVVCFGCWLPASSRANATDLPSASHNSWRRCGFLGIIMIADPTNAFAHSKGYVRSGGNTVACDVKTSGIVFIRQSSSYKGWANGNPNSSSNGAVSLVTENCRCLLSIAMNDSAAGVSDERI